MAEAGPPMRMQLMASTALSACIATADSVTRLVGRQVPHDGILRSTVGTAHCCGSVRLAAQTFT